MRKPRSTLEGLDNKMRVNVREGAMVRAQQGLPRMRTLEDLPHSDSGRAGHRGEPQAPAGTQNGRGLGTSREDGVELMASAINHRLESMHRKRAREESSRRPYMPKRK